MAIEFRCPECSKLLRTADDKAGLQANCPGCGNVVTVPAAPAEPEEPILEAFPVPLRSSSAVPKESTRFDALFGADVDDPNDDDADDDIRDERPCPMCGERIPVRARKCRFCGEDLAPQKPPAATGGGSGEPAGFWLRFAAHIIDQMILGAVTAPVGCLVGVFVGLAKQGRLGQEDELAMQAVLQFFGLIVSWLYEVLMVTSRHRATLGKMAVGIVVTDLRGNPLSFGQATGRFFAKLLSVLTCFVGFMMAGWTERKQALHDMLAGTLVVKK